MEIFIDLNIPTNWEGKQIEKVMENPGRAFFLRHDMSRK